jgi:hypothetical protein
MTPLVFNTTKQQRKFFYLGNRDNRSAIWIYVNLIIHESWISATPRLHQLLAIRQVWNGAVRLNFNENRDWVKSIIEKKISSSITSTGNRRTHQQNARQPSGNTNYFAHNSSTQHGHQNWSLMLNFKSAEDLSIGKWLPHHCTTDITTINSFNTKLKKESYKAKGHKLTETILKKIKRGKLSSVQEMQVNQLMKIFSQRLLFEAVSNCKISSKSKFYVHWVISKQWTHTQTTI